MWILINESSLKLLIELLRKRKGPKEDELLQELLIQTMIPRKAMGSEKGKYYEQRVKQQRKRS